MSKKKSNTPEHLHRYQKVILGGRRVIIKDGKKHLEKCSGYEVFKCLFPGCTHHVSAELAIGREGACWSCGQKLVLNSENIRLKKPTHIYCRRVRALDMEISA